LIVLEDGVRSDEAEMVELPEMIDLKGMLSLGLWENGIG
jgi:hypothetical protein